MNTMPDTSLMLIVAFALALSPPLTVAVFKYLPINKKNMGEIPIKNESTNLPIDNRHDHNGRYASISLCNLKHTELDKRETMYQEDIKNIFKEISDLNKYIRENR